MIQRGNFNSKLICWLIDLETHWLSRLSIPRQWTISHVELLVTTWQSRLWRNYVTNHYRKGHTSILKTNLSTMKSQVFSKSSFHSNLQAFSVLSFSILSWNYIGCVKFQMKYFKSNVGSYKINQNIVIFNPKTFFLPTEI